MKETPVSYKTINEQLDRFFNEDLNASLHTFRQSFAGSLLNELTALRTDIIKLKRDSGSSPALIAERLEDSLNVFKEFLKKPELTETEELWQAALNEAIIKQPEHIRCIQGEGRFSPDETDGRLTRLRKGSKQRLFNVGKLLHRDPAVPYQWTQDIPFRQLLRYGLLCRSDAFTHAVSFEYSRIARALMALLYEVREEVREEVEEQAAEQPQATLSESTEESESGPNPESEIAEGTSPVIQKNDSKKGGNAGSGTQGTAYSNRLTDEATEYITLAIDEIKKHLEDDFTSNPALKAAPEALKILAEKTGTAEFNASRLGEAVLQKQLRSAEKSAQKNLLKWRNYLKSQLADLQVQIELSAFGIRLQQAQETLLKETHTFFRDTCYVPTENGVRILQELISELEQEEKEKQA